MAEQLTIDIQDRLQLRQLSNADTSMLWQVLHESRDFLRKYLNWIDDIRQEAQVSRLIQDYNQQTMDNKGITFGIWQDETLVGCCTLYDWDRKLKKISIGYWVAATHTGQGIATACCKALIKYAFEYLDVEKIALWFTPENTASYKIAMHCGFQIEGLLSNMYILHGIIYPQYVATLDKYNWRKLS